MNFLVVLDDFHATAGTVAAHMRQMHIGAKL